MTDLTLFAFVVVAFIGIATPGPTVLLALANGSRFGVRRAAYGMAGAVLSDFVLIGAAALGLGALLAASEFWFTVVKWLGAGYLAVLGIMLLRSKGSLDGAAAAAAGSGAPGAVFRKCFLVAVTNPKGYLFFSAFLPQFIDPAAPQLPQYALLAVIFAAIDFGGDARLRPARQPGGAPAQALRRALARPHLRRRAARARRLPRPDAPLGPVVPSRSARRRRPVRAMRGAHIAHGGQLLEKQL